ncbi:MFS transporter [Kiritimatiella glycovorans]|uniref:Putative symporter YjmB n=1 Tax=Kiritimatiella glycovorans TaxID=1307763 RepID=A0A0G3EBK3_9BACT|nr:MFS transporter [Kiritimatiella glycovorans]AKJ63688.1 putative symporter YjmB [Kiritimatiella glycovorans]
MHGHRQKHHKTAARDRVGFGGKVAYGLGGLAENTMHNAVNNLVMPIYNIGFGVSPVLLGIAASIFRLWDAMTDPVMGVISDRTRTRWGRRRPYIVLGAICAGVLFAIIWWCPRGMSEIAYFTWFLVSALLFYTAFTVFGVPYLGLGYELSPDYHERTRVMSFRTWFASIGGILMQWLFWMTQRPVFDDTIEGIRTVAIGVGVVLIITGIAPGLFLRERPIPAAEERNTRSRINLASIASVFKVKPFLYIFGALISTVTGMFMVGMLGFYIIVYYLFAGDLGAASFVVGVSGSTYHVCCLLSVPLISWTSSRIGKKGALLIFIGLAVVATLLKLVLYTPENPYLHLIVIGMMAPGLSAVWTLLAAMNADVTDVDELERGVRREGSFGAIFNWTMKLGFAVCFLIAGLILEATGFDEALGGDQAEHTLLAMRILFSLVPAAGLLISMVLIALYPINEEKAYEVRAKLEAIRGEQEAAT